MNENTATHILSIHIVVRACVRARVCSAAKNRLTDWIYWCLKKKEVRFCMSCPDRLDSDFFTLGVDQAKKWNTCSSSQWRKISSFMFILMYVRTPVKCSSRKKFNAKTFLTRRWIRKLSIVWYLVLNQPDRTDERSSYWICTHRYSGSILWSYGIKRNRNSTSKYYLIKNLLVST